MGNFKIGQQMGIYRLEIAVLGKSKNLHFNQHRSADFQEKDKLVESDNNYCFTQNVTAVHLHYLGTNY